MRLVFMGSPLFAVPALQALRAAGHQIAAAYCQPPRPAGRGQRLQPCPVQLAAEALGIAVRTPVSLKRDAAAQAAFAALGAEAAVVAAYGLILPAAVLAAPRLGCLNVHASLLPRHRGASPIQAAILAGDTQTGVTILQMDEGLDTGPMRLAETVPIGPETTAATLHDVLAALGASLIVRALNTMPPPLPQDATRASYAPKLTRADARIDWTQDAAAIDRRVRAFDPWPGTDTTLGGAPLKIFAVALADQQHAALPGTVLDTSLQVACGGGGSVRLKRVQTAGRAAMDAADFLRGCPVPPGTRLGG